MAAETNYAFRISITGEGSKSPLGYIRFGDKGPKGILDSNKDGYYGIEELTEDKLRIVRYTWHKYHDGRVRGTGDRNHRVLAFGRTDDIELLRKYVGEYDCFEESTTGGTTRIFTVDISNKANFSTIYASKAGQNVDIEGAKRYIQDKAKIEELYNKTLELQKAPIEEPKPIINDTNPLTTIDEIMGEQLKELEAKIKKLQAELDLKYNCEIKKGE